MTRKQFIKWLQEGRAQEMITKGGFRARIEGISARIIQGKKVLFGVFFSNGNHQRTNSFWFLDGTEISGIKGLDLVLEP